MKNKNNFILNTCLFQGSLVPVEVTPATILWQVRPVNKSRTIFYAPYYTYTKRSGGS